MRVVLDTIVLVRSIINPTGSCGRVVLERRNRYVPVVSPSIVTEYVGILQRPAVVRKYSSPTQDVLSSVLDLIKSGIVVYPAEIPTICRDPADDKFLAAAMSGNARFIVSEDKDLLDLGNYADIHIVTAAAFLRVLDMGKES